MFARVAILTERGALADTYTYELTPETSGARAGSCVIVPFQQQTRIGYVIETMDVSDVSSTRKVTCPYPSGDVSEQRAALAEWMAKRWYAPIGACLKLMLPPAIRGRIIRRISATDSGGDVPGGKAGLIFQTISQNSPMLLNALYVRFGKDSAQKAVNQLKRAGLVHEEIEISHGGGLPATEKIYSIVSRDACRSWLDSNAKRRPKQAKVLMALLEFENPSAAWEIEAACPDPTAALKALIRAGLVEQTLREVRRQAAELQSENLKHSLTEDQQQALDAIIHALDLEIFEEFLLFGVTASGKTEVYLRSIAETLSRGRGALVLMPEIALTVHAVSQFRARFGDRLAVLHSRLSVGERADEWRRVASGEAPVVLGPRSAVFAPLQNPGLIIIDEEHEPAFKQDSSPRYHAREICRKMALDKGIPLILGSATPSVETFHRARSGSIRLVEMPGRIDSRPMPIVEAIDMRDYAKDGSLTVISAPLRQAIKENLKEGGQSILFLNRRAYGTFVMCRECGFVAACPNCAVAAKHHRLDQTIRCHHCNWHAPTPSVCPSCGGLKIASFGVGTQRVEEELRQAVPEARLLRMDADTTSGKDALVKIIEQFRERQADILVGTQMVAKGLDFPDVLLVGIINADTGLNMPDFRAAERGFQLLVQVAGRAGRGARPGRVLLQTFDPDHYSIQAAITHDYRRFYDEEIKARSELGWPPFGAAGRIIIQDASLDEAVKIANDVKSRILNASAAVEIVGPSPAPIERLKGRCRIHAILRGRCVDDILEALERAQLSQLRHDIIVDVDPMSLL